MRTESKNVGKSTRKIVQVGNGSAVILPIDFLRNTDLERGDKVDVIYSGDILKIKPIRASDIQREMEAKDDK